MTIEREALLAVKLTDVPASYDAHDAILYALGVGFGRDPADHNELPYVVESLGLQTVPSMATVLPSDRIVVDSGLDLRQILHWGESLELFRPLPPNARLLLDQRIAGVYDRGAEFGAEVDIETEIRRAGDDAVVGAVRTRLLARGDGGFGGPPAPSRERRPFPEREPDFVCDLETRPDQALLYRLCGDFNPLHADPRAARQAGFAKPILHGRCSFGIACHAILKTVCAYDFTLIRSLTARFTAVVYPGDTIRTEMWQDGNAVAFRCRTTTEDTVVIDNGLCMLGA
jgi:acyl dehydratase